MIDVTHNKKIIRELQIWTWLAIILPAIAIFGSVTLWALGLTTQMGMYIVVSSSVIVSFAIIWWWWVLSIVGNVLRSWSVTQQRIQDLISDVHEVKELMIQAREKADLVHQERQNGEQNA